MNDTQIRTAVRERYGAIATADAPPSGPCCDHSGDGSCNCSTHEESCCGSGRSCCGPAGAAEISGAIGYSAEEMGSVPEGANLGLGCGNPVALASLAEGETVVDLGSGAGFDCFLAAARVGPGGRVIGVDMTPAMVERARGNAAKSRCPNVEFRLGEIEHLPVADASADAVISNCVINLSPDKAQVFSEALRVLRPGGRLMVSDLVLEAPLPEAVKDSIEAYVGCVAGALLRTDYLEAMEAAGFVEIEVVEETGFSMDCVVEGPGGQSAPEPLSRDDLASAAAAVRSVKVRAVKPG